MHNLEGTKDVESTDIGALEAENERLREGLGKIKRHYATMLEFAKKNDIHLRYDICSREQDNIFL